MSSASLSASGPLGSPARSLILCVTSSLAVPSSAC
uniref:Uncharacterized protein n=1 Tax=virus sp. ctBM815 TaxID=2825806 RepID=A0A8S5RJJ7_9VIRU|nr:MAG TPA: hypothetical protein [virus sp. ctBM815]